jgi:hypothetical protein
MADVSNPRSQTSGKEPPVDVLGWMVVGSTAGANSKAMPGGDEPSGLPGPATVCVTVAVAGGFFVSAG